MVGDSKAMMLYDANKKSALISYLLWFFLGALGAHRFYSGRTGSGVAQLLLFIFGLLLSTVVVGAFLLVALLIWWIIDAFLIPGWISNHNSLLAHQLLPR